MQIPTSLSLILFQFLAGSSLVSASSSCGPDTPCPLTATCTTVTRSSTTTAVCAPTPTCLWVYQGCTFGTGLNCCSGYCAATKCRPTDPRWPDCVEDTGACEADEDCCYNDNKCVDGFCRKGVS